MGMLLSVFTQQLYTDDFYLPKKRAFRAFLIGLIVAFTIIPIIHAGMLLSFDSWQYFIVTLTITSMYVSYLLGGIIYACRFPEYYIKINMFDYIGNSHNIMHVFIVFGATICYFGMRNAFQFLK
jgi:adiponectin receptor